MGGWVTNGRERDRRWVGGRKDSPKVEELDVVLGTFLHHKGPKSGGFFGSHGVGLVWGGGWVGGWKKEGVGGWVERRDGLYLGYDGDKGDLGRDAL